MDVYQRLLQDHQECRDLFAKLDQPQELSAFGRRQFYEDLRMKLVAHDKAEEDTFYNAIDGDQQVHGLVEDGRREHSELNSLLDDIGKLEADDALWMAGMRKARQMFLHHIDEEEQKMFARSRQVLSAERAESVGEEFQNRELRLLMEERRQAH